MDLRAEQQKIIRHAVAGIIFCTLVLASGYAILPRYLEFPVRLADRLAFALRADVFVFLWILFGIRMVARGRFHSAADIKGSAFGPPSSQIAVRVAFLQNTLEQAIVAIGAHLALATVQRSSAGADPHGRDSLCDWPVGLPHWLSEGRRSARIRNGHDGNSDGRSLRTCDRTYDCGLLAGCNNVATRLRLKPIKQQFNSKHL